MIKEDRWDEIRELYKEYTPYILEVSKEDITQWVDPYLMDWKFTPIERMAWGDIRNRRMPFYPQYPALKYFLDFANPYLKINVELDGKDWHDEKKDAKRDADLKSDGWKIYRITGSESWIDFKYPYEVWEEMETFYDEYEIQKVADEAAEFWILNTSDGIFEAINQIHFIKDIEYRYLDFCHQTLLDHKS